MRAHLVKVPHMNSSILRLNKKTITVGLDINEREVRMVGVGESYSDPLLGDCLKISFQDPAFELILREGEFSGAILPGADVETDFYLPLASRCQSKAG